VVAVDAGAFREIIPAHCGLLCEPNHPLAMASAVRQLFAENPACRGAQARRHVETHYAWDTVVTGLLGHYQAVLGAHQPVYAHG
jgi:alpha-1,6-mannosyltransferase